MRDERSITERLRKLAVIPAGSPVIKGIGDDCAIYRPRGSADDLLFTTDMFIEGLHFLRETHKPEIAGRKALVRGLSDIAAMSGTPRFCLISLCVPPWANTKWVDKFFDGVLKMAAATGAIVAGGDLSHGESLFCDVMVCGAVPRGQAIRRDTARPGDELYVSGLLGGSSLGLEKMSGKARTRHLHPEPRLGLGSFLREKLRATSAIDISDGLSLDLQRICLASQVDAAIIAPPCFAGASLEQALHGGEEYELIFTVPRSTRVPNVFEGVRLTRIGEITRAFGSGGTILLNSMPLEPLGYDHFRQPGTATRRDRAV
jgi:thiamine-monophosphate kinase